MCMKKLWLAIVVTALTLTTPLLATAEERVIDLQGFTNVAVSTTLQVDIEIGPDFSVRASSDTNDLGKLEFYVKDQTLYARWEKRWMDFLFSRGQPSAKIRITLPALQGVHASASASVRVFGDFNQHLNTNASSGGFIEVDGFSGGDIFAETSSGGNFIVKGTCAQMRVDASSGSMVAAQDLLCKTIVVKASSGAKVVVSASETIDLGASSGAEVEAMGTAQILNSNSSSGARITVTRQ